MKSPLIMAFHLAAALALSAAFVPQPQPVARQADEPGGTISYGNEYIRWEHEARTGRLVGAYVLNDSPENLLAAPLGFQVAVENGDGETELYENCGEPSSLAFGGNEVAMTYKLCRNGHPDATLPLTVTHTIRYGEWGEATHHVHVEPAGRIARLLRLSPVVLTTTDKFDTCGAREMRVCGTDKWALSGVADWISLRNESAEPYRCARVPLYLLLFKRGGAGIEFCLGSDLAQWEALGPRQNGILRRDGQRHAFEFTVSPFDSAAPRDLDGALDFDFRLTLPFVRPKMAPLRAAVSLFYFNRGAEHRWPTDEDLQELQAGGVSLMRLHNDCDFLHDGIFWRDAVYPPYPEAEMAKMDDCIARAAKFGLRVVPYFSMKEMHPEARWFAEHGLEWAKLNDPNGSVWVTGWTGGLVFGGVMCLKSGWLEVRKATIAEALKNHGFKGVYFDWCAAIECASTRHCDRHHWDIDEQIELLRWANALKGPDGEQYLHMTHVPLLIAENMATMLLTEETSFPDIGPEMFTAHVHFMNTAPRSICNMLQNPTPEDNRRLAMAALLHHATVSEQDPAALSLYRENRAWMEAVTQYDRHIAPGEGDTGTSHPKVGVSFYESRDGSSMAVLANLTAEPVEVRYHCNGRYARQEGTVSLPPLAMHAIRK